MSDYKSAFLRVLSERGYIKDITHHDALDEYCRGQSTPVAYIGFDATADSLHVGSLVQIMMLRRFQQAGGRPIVLMGGGTTKVGDPTDKEKSRPLLSQDRIKANIEGIGKVFARFLDFGDHETGAVMVNNDDWLSKLGYVDFLREIGPHFTINTMVKQDTVARRLANEQPYTFLEFNYVLLQAYDFLELFRRHGCRLQLGGSDQWGNIVAGADLIHKIEGGEAYGLTCPLITTASGAKMGKTAEGAVWLNEARLSAYEYWQFWRNTEDGDVGRFLRLFTDHDLGEIERLEALGGAEINQAKIALADAATALLHGAKAASDARAGAAAAFQGAQGMDNLPTFEVTPTDGACTTVMLLRAAQLVSSNGEARRKINEGAVRVNDAVMRGDTAHDPGDVLSEVGAFKVQVGKKRIALVRPV